MNDDKRAMGRFVSGLLGLASAILVGVLLTVDHVEAHGRGTPPSPVPYRLDALRAAPSDLSLNPNAVPDSAFVNYESPHVHPLDLKGDTLAAVNTADNRVELFDVSSGVPVHTASIPVGFDPVSCRFNTFDDTELWVVNHISDSISIIDLTTNLVRYTIKTGDEPSDVVFTDVGEDTPAAIVSCSSIDTLQAYSLSTFELIASTYLDGEDPRGLALNTSNGNVYAAIFESGNRTTSIRYVELLDTNDSNQASTHPSNHYGGQNPPYNNGSSIDAGTAWVTPHGSATIEEWTAAGETPPRVSILVRQNDSGQWVDDNGADWSFWLDGNFAVFSGRDPGWSMLDNDVAIVSGADAIASATYATNLMNICMAIGVNPATGHTFVVGTEATNEVRFEPNINGTFTRVMLGITDTTGQSTLVLTDLNEEHLSAAQGGDAYVDESVSQSERNKSIGDPRGIAFSPDGKYAYVTGMGSNNVIGLDGNGSGRGLGERISAGHTVEVGEGPTGIVFDGARDQLYVLNRFEGSVSTVDASTAGSESEIDRVSFFDPTPISIRRGRPHFYGTHENSGLGQVACASCHVDTRMDRLAWDLGDPLGEIKPVTDAGLLIGGFSGVHNLFRAFGGFEPREFEDFHPMKGPMTTQTLQDIIGMEPHHWRGDRDGIEEFAGAWEGLQGADAPLDAVSMQEFEDFLDTVRFGPNAMRAIDNTFAGGPSTLPGVGSNPPLDLTNHFATGRPNPEDVFPPPHSPEGTQLPPGNAWQGFRAYVLEGLDQVDCIDCHTLPTGAGSTHFTADDGFGAMTFTDIPLGPNGEAHLAMVASDGTGQANMKTPQLRNQIDKEGFFLAPGKVARAGFGTLHDGSIAGVAEFLSSLVFQLDSDEEVSDIIAFTLSINGGFDEVLDLLSGIDIPNGAIPGPPGGETGTAHAAVGQQVTILSTEPISGVLGARQVDYDFRDTLLHIADTANVDLIATGRMDGRDRSWRHVSGTSGSAVFQTDESDVQMTLDEIMALVLPLGDASNSITFTVVPPETGERLALDHDADGLYNEDERLRGTDPDNASDHVFVDQSNDSGFENGRADYPYNTVSEGVASLGGAPGVISIAAGSYAEPMILDTQLRLQAFDGSASIGQ